MKKVLIALFIALTVLTLSVSVFAGDSDFVKENEFTLVSFNGVNTFAKTGGDITKLEDATFRLLDAKQTYNLKYVAFVGNIANSAPYRYASEGGNDSVLVSKSLADEGWNAQYKNFSNAIGELVSEGTPMGISIALNDYIPDGRRRDNLIAKYIPAEEYINDNGDFLDELNSYMVVENNGQKYMIFSLELWPRTATLNWFIESVEQNPDKYVIVYTQSFIDNTGNMYTMWDQDNRPAKLYGTTLLKAYNLTNIDKARDGEGVWNYAFSKFDNILAVISSHVKTGGIITNKVANARGVETALIGANADVERRCFLPSSQPTTAKLPVHGQALQTALTLMKRALLQ